MSTQEMAVAISDGTTDWYVAIAMLHANRCYNAVESADKTDIALAYADWFRFLNSVTEPAKWVAYTTFVTYKVWNK